MPRRWEGKWFQKSSGANRSRHGKGRGRTRGQRAERVATVGLVQVTFPKQGEAPAPQRVHDPKPQSPRSGNRRSRSSHRATW